MREHRTACRTLPKAEFGRLRKKTVWAYSKHMNRDRDNLADVQWIAQCANRLREQWPRADPTSLEEAALELWQCEGLRTLAPVEAATRWLAPLVGDASRSGTQAAPSPDETRQRNPVDSQGTAATTITPASSASM